MTAFNDLKLSKKYKYIIYKLSDNNKEIVIEEASADTDWDNFREKLLSAKAPRYAVYDFEYTLPSGEGQRYGPDARDRPYRAFADVNH